MSEASGRSESEPVPKIFDIWLLIKIKVLRIILALISIEQIGS